jgi:hypothetical protein
VTYLTKDIRDHLTGSTAIVDAFSDRIFPEVVPQELRTSTGLKREAYPCILISDLTNEPEYDLGGEVGLHTSRIQLDIWTDGTGGKQKLNELAELVRNRLSGYRGQFGTGCYGTAHLRRNDSLAAPPVDGSNVHRRRQSMDFEIIHTADVPTLT